jgi:hypothetical protein
MESNWAVCESLVLYVLNDTLYKPLWHSIMP